VHRPDALALTPESSPLVDLPPIVDAHVHFWDPDRLEYPWLHGSPGLGRSFLVQDFHRAIGDAPIDRVIFVECNCRPEESPLELQLVQELAEQEPRIAGAVAFADLTSQLPLASRLELLSHFPLLRGIRHNIQGHDNGFCLQPSFVEGVREIGRHGLAFDLCATHDQLLDVLTLVERCPDVRFVLDHGGKPAIRDDTLHPWAEHISRLAQLPNVYCKLSGLLTEAAEEWWEDDVLLFAKHILASFGADRTMFGSDWPVLTLAGRYEQWLQITSRATRHWSAAERAAFFGGTAARVYSL
jgi:L-fuconolactonase